MPTGNAKIINPYSIFTGRRTVRRANADAVIDLRERRAWSDDGGDNNSQGDNDPDGSNGNNDGNNLSAAQIAELVKFKEDSTKENATLRNENRKYREQKSQVESDLKTAEEAKLIADKDFETLITNQRAEIETLKQRAEFGDKAIADIEVANQTFVDGIPEHDRWKIPTGYSPTELAKWINSNFNNLKIPTPPENDGGRGHLPNGAQGAVKLTDEQKQFAARIGMTEEEYAKAIPKE